MLSGKLGNQTFKSKPCLGTSLPSTDGDLSIYLSVRKMYSCDIGPTDREGVRIEVTAFRRGIEVKNSPG